MRIPQSTTTEVAPAPKPRQSRRYRWLTLVHQEGVQSVGAGNAIHYPLERPRILIGRDPGPGGIQLDDSRTSRKHAELIHILETGGIRIEDRGSRNGTYVDGERIEREDLIPGQVIRLGGSLLVYSEVQVGESVELPARRGCVSISRLLAESAADVVAPTQLPVLIVGPTGAGKEVMAQRIHEHSNRKGPMVAVNCATFSRELIGSELFGHTQGAFSGAKGSRSGLFMSANGGSVFLDEIAELPLEQQPALLRVLQESKVRPVGSDAEHPVDVRIIAATHQSLDALEARGAFRADLLSRLAGYTIDLPALRDRREEIIGLFRSFLGLDDRNLTTEAAEAMLLYDWPRNIRELRHCAERTRIFARNSDRIDLDVLPKEIQKRDQEPSANADAEMPSKEQLAKLLGEHEGNVAKVARATGKHRQQVYRWLRRHGLDPSSYRDGDPDPTQG